ncbi:hypothetical protein [Pontibacter ramchanderi]|uniref:SpoIIAA-like protein n=1 Tax=Pontibacter ramchanderi TaxID=1179743 RepID=A0A2N3V0E8_9BACT|nr:hypothetical protein [Pontibacter ramchanderi]PKV75085.1 hypothetical protein BD749_0022 [Pontibacter ramchanderi]
MQLQRTLPLTEHLPQTGYYTFDVPHIHQSNIADVKKSIDAYLALIKTENIRHVLLNFSQTEVSVADETFRLVLNYLIIGLKYTEASRIARISVADAGREHIALAAFSQSAVLLHHHVQLGYFKSMHEAQRWLGSAPYKAR